MQEPFPHLIVDNFYTEAELKEIWQELNFLTTQDKMQGSTEIGVAIDHLTGLPKARNVGVVLDTIYSGARNISNILKHNRKIFEESIIKDFASLSPLFSDVIRVNKDITKIKYYDDGDFYDAHHDDSRYSVCTYFYKDREKVKGGELHFPDFDYSIETINNRAVFFKGCIPHQAFPSYRVDDWKPFDGYGRYCMNQFLDFVYMD